MISLSFTVGKDDLLAFSKTFHEQSPTVQAAIRRSQIIFPAIMALGAIYAFLRYGGFVFLIFIVFGALWFILYPPYLRRHMLKTTEKILKESSHEKSLGDYHLTLDEEGISSTAPTGEGKYKWEAIDRVFLTPSHLHIVLAGPMGYPIPRNQIGEDLIQQVKTYAETKIKK